MGAGARRKPGGQSGAGQYGGVDAGGDTAAEDAVTVRYRASQEDLARDRSEEQQRLQVRHDRPKKNHEKRIEAKHQVTDDEWRAEIQKASLKRPAALKAFTYRQKWDSWSAPRVLALRDGAEFVVKMRQHGRPVMDGAIFTECLAGKLGILIGAAVALVELIEVDQTLIDLNPELAPMMPGIAHGSLRVADVSERGGFTYIHLAENRKRFALFAVLYGWIGLNSDHQFFYANFPPEYVYSFDHGFSFGQNGQQWDAARFSQCPQATPDLTICSSCCLTSHEINTAIYSLRQVTDVAIAIAVSVPPDEWNVPLADRISIAAHLAVRRDTLLSLLP